MKGPKRKGLNNKKKKGAGNKPKATSPTTPSIEECIEAGDAAASSLEGDKALACYTTAEQLLQKALAGNTGSDSTATATATIRDQLVYVLEKLGESKASMGDVDGARAHFEQALQVLQQQTPPEQTTTVHYHESLAGLYLYLGQLSLELEALEVHKKGLQSLEMCVQLQLQQSDSAESMDLDDQKEAQEALYRARQKLGQAYATVAELYLTDLCFEDNAETECESYVDSALKITDTDGEPLVDALQTAASLRLSQSRKHEAMKYILKAYDKMKTGCESLSKLVGLEEASKRAVELEEVDAADSLPSFDFRCQTAKLLLECSAKDDTDEVNNTASRAANNNNHHPKPTEEQARCNRAAIQVLASLLAENDEVPECFYLLGCAFHAADNNEEASHYWTKALEMLTSIQKDLEKQSEELASDSMEDDDDFDEIEAQLQSISCQIEEVQSKLEEIEEKEEAMEE